MPPASHRNGRLRIGGSAAKALHARLDAIDAAIQAQVQHVHNALVQDYQAALAREQAMGMGVDALTASMAEQRRRAIQYANYRYAAAGIVFVAAAGAAPLGILRGGLVRLDGAEMLGGVLTMYDTRTAGA